MSQYAGLSPLPAGGSRLVVAGGCGGIGRALVAAGVSLGLDITVLDLPGSIAAHPVPEGVGAIPLDASSEASVGEAFRRLGEAGPAIDALVNLVGFTKERIPIERMDAAEWDEVMDGSLRSAFLIARAALPMLRASGAGAIVNTSSTFGVRVPFAGYGPYSVAKAGIINLTRVLATEGAPAVRANALAPGIVDTQFLRGGTGRAEKESRVDQSAVLAGIPLGRLGQPEDMVGPLLFLCSPAAGYLTGQTLHVNGGLWS
ncbi:SDR family NAD(P)-dependent oxidoreductase [Sphingopyxis granuli]|uniref:SDR family NAD(P)-dependent oxidoreductase n=1 Tax=Sphingopyxis granuli TaxID=267128 RepID=UPI001A448B85|nr:SDR family NAD(P)-dependent oxidoreductase [Sphingopyxis granuli]MBL8649943.1 SDR family oxidoreductase [Sphingopyxis sp.]QUM74606.1 SDR family oxidoreductase [Sphingopyxis granuli]